VGFCVDDCLGLFGVGWVYCGVGWGVGFTVWVLVRVLGAWVLCLGVDVIVWCCVVLCGLCGL